MPQASREHGVRPALLYLPHSDAYKKRRDSTDTAPGGAMTSLLAGLNASQRTAVLHNQGPLLVLAGAGSGKTRVLTARVARLVGERHCRPKNILAVTFTNKAAREMRERLAKLVSTRAAAEMTICTFHSFGARVLREHGSVVGLHRGFTILDEHQRMSSLRALARNTAASNEQSRHLEIATRISLLKNASRDPDQLDDEDGIRTAKVYKAYQAALRKRRSVDFDDLLLTPLRIFENHPDILQHYRERYHYVCIDEYQDTNAVQMKLARLIATPRNNIMVVGDDDQSIYSWRGADSENVLSFARTYKGCTTVILDTNYRSTACILDAAMAVVANNRKRTVKQVRAAADGGGLIEHYRGEDETDEAEYVARSIKQDVAEKRHSYYDHALLCRTNAMMRRFEEELRRAGVPYRVVGAMSFFDRKEVKDIIAYMRFLSNPDDELSLTRVMKVPDAGITKPTVTELERLAARRGTTLYSALQHAESADNVSGSQLAKCQAFAQWSRDAIGALENSPAHAVLRDALAARGYIEALRKASRDEPNAQDRVDNVEEILHGLALFEKKHRRATLSEYVQELTLKANDNDQDEKNGYGVTLMTVHKAKGLEFEVVYLVGLDDGVFPSPRAVAEGAIEEERRLFYVAMTRAKRRLILTYPHTRLFRNKDVPITPCRFIREIPAEFLDGELGEKEEAARNEYLGSFFREMQERFGGEQDEQKEKPPRPKPSDMPQKSALERLRALKGRGM
ncbi:MAG: AAA family ATPase [Chitinivibrionales bacterium]|nr:AAA family ATPase [Chitinivibrionales bacterium]